jgi:hypothetical protein
MTSATISAAPPPAPRYEIAWALLIYVGCVLLLGYPALTGGFLVTPPSDQYIGGFPVRDFAAQSLKAGEGFPLWNPYIYGGMPYVAAMGVGDIFYPTFLLRAALPVDVAMTLAFMIHVVLAALVTYVFCRSVGLSFGASLVGGAAYAMSGPIAGLVSPGHDGKLYVSALLPLVLYLLTRYMRRGDLWALGGLAIAIGLAVLSPHPQLLQYLLLTAGFYGLFLAFGEWNGERLASRIGVQRLGFALGAVALGFLMGAIQYAPFLEYIPWSPRAGGKGWEHAVSFSMPPEELLISTYLPEFSGILGQYWGRNGIHHHSEYVGPVVLILATAAIGAGGKGGAVAFSRPFKLFWLGVLIISALWALGGFTPFYRLVYAIVPGTKYFRAPSTMMYISMFATALFAAIGAERVLSANGVTKRFLTTWGIVAVVIAVLALSGGFTNLGMAIVGTATMGGQPMSERVADNASAVAIGGLRSLVFALVALAVLWGISTRRLAATGAIGALLVVAVVDLWSVERKYWQFSESAASLYAGDPIIDLLKPQRDSARVFAIALPGADVAYHDPMIQGDGLMIHGIRQVRGYHGNQLGRYDRLIGEESGLEPVVTMPHVWSLLNMRYVLTNVPPTSPIVRQLYGALVAGPVRNAAGTMVYLYNVPGENPPAWVASGVVKAPDEAALATLHDARFNAEMQRRVALIDTASTLPVITDATTVPPPSTIVATVRRPGNGQIVVDLSAPAQDGNMLIVSENFYPGWQARVDGKDTGVERADYVLIGVPLSAGARTIELQYESGRYEIGKLITLAATGVALMLVIVGWLVDRRRTQPVPARLATEVS